CAAAWGSPCSTADRMRVTSVMKDSIPPAGTDHNARAVEPKRPADYITVRDSATRTCSRIRQECGLAAPARILGECGYTRIVHANLVVVQDCAAAAVLGEQRVAAVAEQVEVKRLVGLLLAVTLDFDGDGFRRLAGGEGQRAGLGDVVAVARLGGAVGGAER